MSSFTPRSLSPPLLSSSQTSFPPFSRLLAEPSFRLCRTYTSSCSPLRRQLLRSTTSLNRCRLTAPSNICQTGPTVQTAAVSKMSCPNPPTSGASSFYDFKPLDNKGEPHTLSKYKGHVVLVVNVASKCGFTPQYTGLEALYKKYSPTGKFTVLGFPCNQFGGQEPGTADDIQQFCTATYGVTFPILGKIDVNDGNEDPLWAWLKKERPGVMGIKTIKWNFEKFLVGPDGTVVDRWASTTKPDKLEQTIEDALVKAGVEKDKLQQL